ncbi:hypothetical protein L1887_51359 [Cichorium endivia]|nr:hypothetical protein L1887_51359 [Cichorium endivia]
MVSRRCKCHRLSTVFCPSGRMGSGQHRIGENEMVGSDVVGLYACDAVPRLRTQRDRPVDHANHAQRRVTDEVDWHESNSANGASACAASSGDLQSQNKNALPRSLDRAAPALNIHFPAVRIVSFSAADRISLLSHSHTRAVAGRPEQGWNSQTVVNA